MKHAVYSTPAEWRAAHSPADPADLVPTRLHLVLEGLCPECVKPLERQGALTEPYGKCETCNRYFCVVSPLIPPPDEPILIEWSHQAAEWAVEPIERPLRS